jgi:ABC-2 type transport system ATP-binding protein
MSHPETAIVVDNLVKVYREGSRDPVRALDGLTLAVERGKIFGLLGRNGAGKTTLLRILTTLVLPTSGRASVLGTDVVANPDAIRRNICAVLQENAVELYLSVFDNLATYARFHSIPRREIPARADRAMEQFGLTHLRNQKVMDLSGGLKRRVQVAKVFMVDKPVVFLDEATTGMDPINKRATIEAIRNQAKAGTTIVLTTHVLNEADELCDTIAIIDGGKLLLTGDVQTIKAVASTAFDVAITFEELTDTIMERAQLLPVSRLTRKGHTLEFCVAGKGGAPIDIIATLAQSGTVVHIEVTGATLEDVFLDLLGSDPAGKTVT